MQCISAGVILYAISFIVVKVLPISIHGAIIYISLFTALYTYSGGISTVIWTDMLQSAVLLIGSICIFFILVMNLFQTSAAILENLADSLVLINTDLDFSVDTTLWSGLLAVSFLHLSVYGSFFIYLFFSLMGVLLYLFYGGKSFENSNNIILDFVFNYTNPIIIGLIISALMAAAMSTLDSTYNSMATVATFDIYKHFFRPKAENKHLDNVARKLSLLCAIAVTIPAMLAVSNESVLKTIASLTSIFVGIRLGSFLLGLFFNKANEKGVIVGSVMSIIAIIICRWMDISWPWFALAGTLVF